jgi:hypothetical protein
LLVGGLGCATVSPNLQSPASDQATASQQPLQPSVAPVELEPDADVRLLDAGAEPRAPLRLHPRVGDVVRWEFGQQMSMQITVDGETSLQEVGYELSFATETLEVDERAGICKDHTVLTNAKVLGEFEPEVADALASNFLGTEIWMESDLRGRELDSKVVSPNAALNSTNDLGNSMIFPEQPIGIGARWQETDAITVNGIEWLRTSEHVLVGRGAEQVEIESTWSLQPVKSKVVAPNGVQLSLEHVDVVGLGRASIDLRTGAPVWGEFSTKGDFEVIGSSGRGELPMVISLTSQMWVRTGE